MPVEAVRTSRASAAETAMLVVQLLVSTLYHSGCVCRLLARSMCSRKILRTNGGFAVVGKRYTFSFWR